MTTPPLTPFQRVQADVLARMPTPTPEWELLDRTHSRDEYQHEHVAVWEVDYDEDHHRFFIECQQTVVDGNPVLHFFPVIHQEDSLYHEFHDLTEYRASTWSELTTNFAVFWERQCARVRQARAVWDYGQQKLRMAGITTAHVLEGEAPPAVQVPAPEIPGFQQRIHDVATIYDAWEDANTAATNQDYNRTRLWFRVWLGYAWYRATQQTHLTTLEVLNQALGAAGSRNIVGYDQIMRWIIEPLEWWGDAGINYWRTAFGDNAAVQVLLGQRDLFQVNSGGGTGEAIRGSVGNADWTAYGNAQYEAARDWTPPTGSNG